MRQFLSLSQEHVITLQDIIRFSILQQSREQGEQSLLALSKELTALLQMTLIRILLDPTISEERQRAVYRLLRSAWIQGGHRSARAQFGTPDTERATREVIAEERGSLRRKIETLFQECPWLEDKGISRHTLEAEIDTLIAQRQEGLPARTLAKSGGLECTLEVEKEQELEIEQHLTVEVDVEKEKKTLGFYHGLELIESPSLEEACRSSYLNNYRHPYFPLSWYFDRNPQLQPFAAAFADIDITLNVLQWTSSAPSIAEVAFFGEHRTPLHYLRFDQKGERILLNTQYDEREIDDNDSLKAPRFGKDSLSHNLTLGPRQESAPRLTEPQKRLLVKVKFLNGNCEYTREEQRYLRDWLQAEGADKMEQFYLEHVLSGFPNKRSRYYRGSALQRLFQELKT